MWKIRSAYLPQHDRTTALFISEHDWLVSIKNIMIPLCVFSLFPISSDLPFRREQAVVLAAYIFGFFGILFEVDRLDISGIPK